MISFHGRIKSQFADLRWDSHEIPEEERRDLSQLKHLDRNLDAHVNEQNVQHSAAVQVDDLGLETGSAYSSEVYKN